MIVVADGQPAAGSWAPGGRLVNGDGEAPFTNLESRVLVKDAVQSDGVPAGLTTQPRRYVKVTANHDVRVVIWLTEVPIQIVQ